MARLAVGVCERITLTLNPYGHAAPSGRFNDDCPIRRGMPTTSNIHWRRGLARLMCAVPPATRTRRKHRIAALMPTRVYENHLMQVENHVELGPQKIMNDWRKHVAPCQSGLLTGGKFGVVRAGLDLYHEGSIPGRARFFDRPRDCGIPGSGERFPARF